MFAVLTNVSIIAWHLILRTGGSGDGGGGGGAASHGGGSVGLSSSSSAAVGTAARNARMEVVCVIDLHFPNSLSDRKKAFEEVIISLQTNINNGEARMSISDEFPCLGR